MSMTYRELRLWLRQELSDRENLDQEIRWLIEAFSGKNILDIEPEEEVSRPVFYEKAVKRLQHHEPFQYVVGSQEFFLSPRRCWCLGRKRSFWWRKPFAGQREKMLWKF